MLTQDQERAIVRRIEEDPPAACEDLASAYVAHAWDMFRVLVGPDDARIAVARNFG